MIKLMPFSRTNVSQSMVEFIALLLARPVTMAMVLSGLSS